MKNLLLAFIVSVFATALLADAPKSTCTCQSGGTCACPEGKCACASGEKKDAACTCQSGGSCACPAGQCACKPAAEVEKKNCGCACCVGKAVCCCHEGDGEASAAAPVGHPLKGVVVDVLADKKALLVKHEEIPGVMKAMTMLLRVDEATLASVKKGDAITARLTNEDGAWWLREVKAAAK